MIEQEEKGAEFNLEKYLGIVRRRHWHFLIPLFLGWLIVWGASWVLPPRYKSTTLILVEQPSMPKDYVTPNINDDVQERLQSITQQILSRTRLLHIIDSVNLYSQDRTRANPDELIDRMRKDIEIELVRGDRNEITAFNVSFSAGDPHVAQQVTSELTNLFISENLETRQQKSEDTTKFLESQLEEARKTLAEQEEKVREFKTEHPGELPTQTGSNIQILAGLQSQLQNDEDSLNTAKQQNAYLLALLEQYRSVQKPIKTKEGAPLALPTLDAELDKLKAQLADLTSHYTDQHPDVRKVKAQIAKTEKQREQALADMKASASAAQANSSGADASQTDTTTPGEGSAMIQLQGQLKSNQIEVTNREHDIAALKASINEYQARLNQEPVREQQYADLTRGYDQSKQTYDDLLKKKNESEMATSMELRQQGEHFRMIDPPSLPLKPDFPNRLKLCGIGLGVGIALGAVFAGGTEFMDDRVYDENELKQLLPVAVISEVPVVSTADDEKKVQRETRIAWVAAALVFASVLAGSAFSFFRG